ncbi:hypothetical protein [Leeuwenhoekiella nanhaiensis]|uniref:DUF1049 domain-containing protein n=1 Tax=Leeuwenhoekiella nanhaiensis TaxID=1655491 RepID=A0A2G1VTK4_9FLAO|nr:hypothetical protein [Leeuwenhoekiella nanhaiensis]PHQ30096.1 hypothetical protein CJ305_03790 [Leeuwenhoekiella nanhaiensis]
MIRNLVLILIILAMLLNILNFDLASFDLKSNQTWIFLGAILLAFIGSVLLVVNILKTNSAKE